MLHSRSVFSTAVRIYHRLRISTEPDGAVRSLPVARSEHGFVAESGPNRLSFATNVEEVNADQARSHASRRAAGLVAASRSSGRGVSFSRAVLVSRVVLASAITITNCGYIRINSSKS